MVVIMLILAGLQWAGSLLLAAVQWVGEKPGSGREEAFNEEITILVAARDEEESLPFLLASVQREALSGVSLRLVVADDHSRDNTARLVREYAARATTGLKVELRRYPAVRGKVEVLKRLVAEETPEKGLVVFTDADCSFAKGYFRRLLELHTRAGREILLGGAVVPTRGLRGFTAPWQKIDFLLLSGIGSSTSLLGLPLSAFGANLSLPAPLLRKLDYARQITTGTAEDLQLSNLVRRRGVPVIIRLDRFLQTFTAAEKTRTAVLQRLRWARSVGSLRGAGRAGLWGAALVQLLVPLLFFSTLLTGHPAALATAVYIGMVVFSNLLLLLTFCGKLRKSCSLPHLVLYPFYLLFLSAALAFRAYQGQSDWDPEG